MMPVTVALSPNHWSKVTRSLVTCDSSSTGSTCTVSVSMPRSCESSTSPRWLYSVALKYT